MINYNSAYAMISLEVDVVVGFYFVALKGWRVKVKIRWGCVVGHEIRTFFKFPTNVSGSCFRLCKCPIKTSIFAIFVNS